MVAYLIYDVPADVGGILAVHGRSFPGLTSDDKRPYWIIVPDSVCNKMRDSIGAFVDALLTWCLDPTRQLLPYQGTPPALA